METECSDTLQRQDFYTVCSHMCKKTNQRKLLGWQLLERRKTLGCHMFDLGADIGKPQFSTPEKLNFQLHPCFCSIRRAHRSPYSITPRLFLRYATQSHGDS
ncbi:unnamed protein product [Ectocarpus sp. 12 AP-2014]